MVIKLLSYISPIHELHDSFSNELSWNKNGNTFAYQFCFHNENQKKTLEQEMAIENENFPVKVNSGIDSNYLGY